MMRVLVIHQNFPGQFGHLADLDEADVLVVDDDLGGDLGVLGHDDHQHLRWSHDTAFGVDRHLLHSSGHRCRELSQALTLLGLTALLGQLLALQRGLRLALAQRALRFGNV